MRKVKPKPAGIRIDGGKRIDLNRQRVAARMSGVAKAPLSPEQVHASIVAKRKEDDRMRRQSAKLRREDGGKEGARVSRVKVRISSDRSERQLFRCKPGSFEWRYGRNKQDVLFHAGSHLSRLWETAGMTVASSVDFLRGTRSGFVAGMAEGRIAAIDKLEGFRKTLGLVSSAQLIDYCVIGFTASEIAHKNGMKERDMATILHHHLRVCAKHFDFM
ncbi:hypothetical protein [Nitrosomonas communis]|uniref:hypothetical protein n=1 Tax=Nitrosomonas communis TaxID=44574 RepID=UPI003D277B0B